MQLIEEYKNKSMFIITSMVSLSKVRLVLIPNGQSMWILSLFNCNKNTINTNNELNMKNAKTDLFRNSSRSFATRSFFVFCFIFFCEFFWMVVNENKKKIVVNMVVGFNYLLCGFIVCYVSFNAQRPFNVQIVLVQLQQKYNQNKQCVHHEEGEHRGVTQFFQIGSNASLTTDWFLFSVGLIQRLSKFIKCSLI